MPEVKIISITQPIYDPYVKTPEELIENRYVDAGMVHATLEIITTFGITEEILNFSENFHWTRMLSDELEYEYNNIEDEEWFMLQMDLWQNSLKAYNKALELGMSKRQAKYFLPQGMLGASIDLCGSIMNWNQWLIEAKNSEFNDIVFIADMTSKALNKYFPNHIEE
jgi:hypothetical protein